MTMRAVVSRDTDRPTTGWGHPEPPQRTESHTIPCKAWVKTRVETRSEGKEAVIEDLRARVPAGADILEGDAIEIRDRLGAVLYAGPIEVRTVTRIGSSGSRSGHKLLMLRRHH